MAKVPARSARKTAARRPSRGTGTPPASDPSEAKRISEIIRILRARYGEVTGFLDYRNHFELLIAVILSAQTTDRQVNAITPALFERFPSPQALAAAQPGEVEGLIHSIGFFRTKARNIIKTSAALIERHGGRVPQGMEALTALPGVGRKSANVVRGSCFGLPAVIVDTHFGRVATRLAIASGGDPVAIEQEVRAKVGERDQTALSMLLNKHGRVYCHARRPECPRCPVCHLCPYPHKTVE